MTIKQIVEDTDTKYGRYFDLLIQFLIVISLITFSIETLPNLNPNLRRVLRIVEVSTIAAFSLEYLVRVCVADNRLSFIFSFFGLIDLLAILPFYLSTGIDLRAIRSFRLLRILRILKLVRYSKAIRRFKIAYVLVKEELVLFFFMAMILLYLSSVGIYYFEHIAQPKDFASIFHSMWWAIVTVTTVGYGDVVPVTIGGRIFTFFVLLVGIGTVAVPTGLLASALSKAREIEK